MGGVALADDVNVKQGFALRRLCFQGWLGTVSGALLGLLAVRVAERVIAATHRAPSSGTT